MKMESFDEKRDSGARTMPARRMKGLSTRDRPAAEKVLRTVRNLGRVGLTPAEIGWLFDLPTDLVGPVLD